MTYRYNPRAWLVLALLALLAACGRSNGFPECPAGFRTSTTTGECFCSSSAVCPSGYGCVDGSCRCTSDACCPANHHLVPAAGDQPDLCQCSGDSCCPEGTRFQVESGSCRCASDACCPPKFRYNAAEDACACSDDACCPTGFRFDAAAGVCACADDVCCPDGYRFDGMDQGCTCASNSCCPPNHVWNPAAKACVCTGVGCCPPGFSQDVDGRCLCVSNEACPGTLRCDLPTGRCLCSGPADCDASTFCNRFGFCQSLDGCTNNEDCPTGRFCDTLTHRCTLNGLCGSDLHCALGEICDETNHICVQGCRGTGDCVLGDTCIRGQCQSMRCEDSSYCELRSFCDTQQQSCQPPDLRYCQSCDFGCNDGPCLISIIEGKGFTFCGVPCVNDLDCPGGMLCDDSYTNCGGPGGFCDGDLLCLETEVLNQVGTSFMCSDPVTRRPTPTGHFCAPKTDACN